MPPLDCTPLLKRRLLECFGRVSQITSSGDPQPPDLTAARTDRVIRLPSPLGWASDHRHSQAKSGFHTNDQSRVNI